MALHIRNTYLGLVVWHIAGKSLWCWHSIWMLVHILLPHFCSSFLLMVWEKQQKVTKCASAPATHVGDQCEVSGSWPWPGPALSCLTIETIEEVNQQMKDNSIFLSVCL